MASKFKSKPLFQRKILSKICQLPGTKASIHNSQLLISTGVPSLDAVIGGGVAVGAVVLIEEDTYSTYSNVLFKYFLAEGVISEHHLLLASMNIDPAKMLKGIPSPLGMDASDLKYNCQPNSRPDSLKIAWQYKNMPAVKTSIDVSKFAHYYDLSKAMDPDLIEKTRCHTFTPQACSTKGSYDQLIRCISSCIKKEGFSTGVALKESSTVLRIALHSMCSPLWDSEEESKSSIFAFCHFLYKLRAILRYSLATCLITIPAHLQEDPVMVKRIERMCDIVVRLESFASSEKETNPIFKDYQGLFHVIKTSTLNSLTCYRPAATDYGFKLRRRKFIIETLHLPPELPETTNRGEEDEALSSIRSLGCVKSPVGQSKLDF